MSTTYYTEECPCKGCTERQMKCHGSCEKYAAWKKTFVRVVDYDGDRQQRRKLAIIRANIKKRHR